MENLVASKIITAGIAFAMMASSGNYEGVLSSASEENTVQIESNEEQNGKENNVTEKRNIITVYANHLDNNVDDTKAIEEAINKAKPGDEVFLPNGVYNLMKPSQKDPLANIVLKSGVNITGESKNGVILKSYFNSGVKNEQFSIIKGTSIKDVSLTHFTLTSTYSGNFPQNPDQQNPTAGGPLYGMVLDVYKSKPSPCSNITVRDLKVEKFKSCGIRAANTSACSFINITVLNATDTSSGNGIGMCIQGRGHDVNYLNDPRDSAYNSIKDSKVKGPYLRHGILLQYSTHNNTIDHCNLDKTQMDSIDLHGEDEYLNEICNNKITNSVREGAIGLGNSGAKHDASGRGNRIYNNTIENCKYGIRVLYGTQGSVIENNVMNGALIKNGAGIIIGNAANTNIKGNQIKGFSSANACAVKFIEDIGSKWSDGSYHNSGKPKNILFKNNDIQNNNIGVFIEAGKMDLSNNTIANNVKDVVQ